MPIEIFTLGYEGTTQFELIVALLCFERDPDGCYRSSLIVAVASDAERVDLFP